MAHPFWTGKNVVVAGATGFLGGWMVRRLLEHGANVITVVRNPGRQCQIVLESLIDRTSVWKGSVYDEAFVEQLFTRNQIDVFFHAAYGADVNCVLREPVECFRSSALSTWLILDLIRRNHPSCVTVISSSDKAYGDQEVPFREANALTPIHPYEVAKASQDLAAQSFGRIYGVPVAVTRCGNYFGPYDFNFTRLIPGVCASIAEGQRPQLRSDGRFTRDFLYIEDAVDVQFMLAERLSVDASLYGQAFNFSYGEQLEVIDIVRRVSMLAGGDVQPRIMDDVKAEIRHMHLSSEKAETLLDWQPRVGFEEGLRRTVKWYLSFLGQGQSERTGWRSIKSLLLSSAPLDLMNPSTTATEMFSLLAELA